MGRIITPPKRGTSKTKEKAWKKKDDPTTGIWFSELSITEHYDDARGRQSAESDPLAAFHGVLQMRSGLPYKGRSLSSFGELTTQNFVHGLRIGFALRFFHDLTDKPAENLFVSATELFHLI